MKLLRIFEKSNFITFFQRGKYSQALPKEYLDKDRDKKMRKSDS